MNIASLLGFGPYFGKLVDMNGDYVRMATKAEWEESQALHVRLGTMGYIVIDTISPMGVPHKICVCLLEGPTDNDSEQPILKGKTNV